MLSKSFLFSSYSNKIFSSTALLKVTLSIPNKYEVSKHLTDADLGEEYNNANSPNPSPERNSRFGYFYINIVITISSTDTFKLPL